VVSWSIGLPGSISLYCWGAGRAAGGRDRNGEADPDEEVLVRRVGQGGDDTDHVPGPIEQRAAAVAGVDGRVELDQAFERGTGGRVDRAVGGRDDAGGEAGPQAQRVADREDGVADRRCAGQHRRHDDLGQPVDGEHRDVVLGLPGRDLRPRLRAVGELHPDLRRPVDDVQGREHRAARVDDHAAAQAGGAAFGPLRGHGDQRRRDRLVRERRLGWDVPLGLLCLLDPALHGGVDVGTGERGRAGRADPPQTGGERDDEHGGDGQQDAPARARPLRRARGLADRRPHRSHVRHATPETRKSR
jgi:hypothetical protein